MAAFLYRFAGKPHARPPRTATFTDVPMGNPFFVEVEWLAERTIATGWPTNGGAEYRPAQPITRDAMAAFLYRFHTNVSHAGETPRAAAPQPAALDQIAKDLLALVNREREAVGAHPLTWNDPIAGVSESWTGVMLSHGKLYHNPTYSDQYPSGWSAAAENIAQNYWNPGADAAAALMDQWMNSSGHKANILNPRFTHIGVGLAVSESGDLYACQNFARY